MKRKGQRSETVTESLIADYELMAQNGQINYLCEEDWLSLIDHFVVENNIQKALSVSEAAIRQHSFSIELHIEHARMLLASDLPQEALNFLEEKSFLSPNDPEFILGKAQASCALNMNVEALELLQEIKLISDNEIQEEISLTEADIFEKLQEFNLMFDSLQNVLLHNPKHAEALERIWLCTELSGRYDDSIALHNKLLEEDSYCYQAWYNLGQAYYSIDQHEDAANSFEYAYLINEDFEFAYRDRGEALLEMGKFDEALKCYTEVKERFVPDADLYYKIGKCYSLKEQPELALEYFAVSQQMGNLDDEINFHMAICLGQLNRFPAAIASLEKAISLDPDREDYYLALADMFFQSENNDEALIHYQKAVDLAPDLLHSWLQFAGFLLLTFGDEAALETIDEAEFYCPSAELAYFRVVCMMSAGKRQEAILKLMQLVDSFPEKVNYLFEVMPELKEDSEVNAILAGM